MTELAERYGGSLYELALSEGLDDRILVELSETAAIFEQNPDYLRLLSQPAIPKAERCRLLDEAFGGQTHPYILNFLKILCENGNLRALSACNKVYRRRYNKAHGIVDAVVVSAVPLSKAEQDRLQEKLSALSKKTVRLSCKVDSAVIGGLRVDMDDNRLDGTVRQRLDRLRAEISDAPVSFESH